MSQNRKFIEMLVVCDRLKLDKDIIDTLSNINDQDINLRLLCKYIENIFCAKTELNKSPFLRWRLPINKYSKSIIKIQERRCKNESKLTRRL